MPRRKQDYPKKHDSGTDSATSQGECAMAPSDQQESDLPLDCSKSSTSPPTSDRVASTDSIDKDDLALDLSTRKRRRDEEIVVPSASTVLLDPMPRLCKTTPEPSTFSPSMPSMPLLNLVNDSFFNSSASPSSNPFSMYFNAPPFPFSSSASPLTATSHANADSLSKLSSLVHQVGKGQKPQATATGTGHSLASASSDPTSGNDDGGTSLQEALGAAAGHGLSFQELWLRFVKKEENAELKRLNEAKQIFTCLQCHASFQTMEQLVKHMETTQHYANIPKHYSWSLQYARQRMRQMKMKMKYSDKMMYYCFLCTAPFTEPVHIHFNCVHNMHNPVENMKFVHVISVNGKNSGKTLATGRHGGTATATPPSGDQRRRRRSNDDDNRFSSSPLSIGASSCDSDSASPTPSTSSKRSTNTRLVASSSPDQADSNNFAKNVGVPTDDLLLKMEKLVESAAGNKCDQRRPIQLAGPSNPLG